MNEGKEIIKKKVEFYFSNKLEVHITKKNNWFHNGFIKELKDDSLILDDDKEGLMPIFFEEVFEIQKREAQI